MLAKEHQEFIDLKDRPTVETASMPMMGDKKPESRGPSLYISDIDLPLTEDDVDKSLTAEVKITLRRISTSSDSDKKTKSFDLEVTGIKFKD